MHLLYCVNGIVVATHDDAQVVPISAYGTDVRIIPWNQSLGNLERVGDFIPGPVAIDTRPYAQPEETPEILKLYAGQSRFNYESAGTVTKSVPIIHTDRESQLHIATLAQYAATLNASDRIDFTQDGVAYQITARDAIDMNTAIGARVQTARSKEAQCIAGIDAGTITTYDQVDAAFAAI